MICPKCGTEIEEEKMYCSCCGQEVRIVPDFEPEVEHTIDQTMDHILQDVFQKDKRNAASQKKSKKDKTKKTPKRKKHYYLWIILLLLVSFVVLFLVFGYMNYTADYQIRRGNYYFKLSAYAEAIKHYEKAESIDPENVEIALYLAECYAAMEKMAGYEANLTKVIQNENVPSQYLKLAYNGLANLYLENGEYHKIAKLLKTCTEPEVIENFEKYLASPPKFSHEEGEYEDMIPLKIQTGDKGTVYYTTDGTDPTTESNVYSTPIFLDKGEYTIKAIYVNEFGVVSDIITGKFKIKF